MRAPDPSTWSSAVPWLYSGLFLRQCCEPGGFSLGKQRFAVVAQPKQWHGGERTKGHSKVV